MADKPIHKTKIEEELNSSSFYNFVVSCSCGWQARAMSFVEGQQAAQAHENRWNLRRNF